MIEHLEVYAFTVEEVKVDEDSAIKENNLFCSHSRVFSNFSQFTSNNNKDFNVTSLKKVLLKRDYPLLK